MKQITHVRKDYAGDITAVGAKFSWEHTLTTAISNIENGWESYWVSVGGQAATVCVSKTSAGRKYLKTTADTTTKNNLDNLPPL